MPASMTMGRGYTGVAHRVQVGAGVGARMALDVVAGGRVRLEVASKDGEGIKFKIWRTREDGSAELVNPVTAPSGFKLTTLEAVHETSFVLEFPEARGRRELVVWLECDSPASRCTPAVQPGEACGEGAYCDEGLVCVDEVRGCSGSGARGRCHEQGRNPVCASL